MLLQFRATHTRSSRYLLFLLLFLLLWHHIDGNLVLFKKAIQYAWWKQCHMFNLFQTFHRYSISSPTKAYTLHSKSSPVGKTDHHMLTNVCYAKQTSSQPDRSQVDIQEQTDIGQYTGSNIQKADYIYMYIYIFSDNLIHNSWQVAFIKPYTWPKPDYHNKSTTRPNA